MSATPKHDHFVRLTMGDHPVTILPGIGLGNMKALRRKGYYKVPGCNLCLFSIDTNHGQNELTSPI